MSQFSSPKEPFKPKIAASTMMLVGLHTVGQMSAGSLGYEVPLILVPALVGAPVPSPNPFSDAVLRVLEWGWSSWADCRR